MGVSVLVMHIEHCIETGLGLMTNINRKLKQVRTTTQFSLS